MYYCSLQAVETATEEVDYSLDRGAQHATMHACETRPSLLSRGRQHSTCTGCTAQGAQGDPTVLNHRETARPRDTNQNRWRHDPNGG